MEYRSSTGSEPLLPEHLESQPLIQGHGGDPEASTGEHPVSEFVHTVGDAAHEQVGDVDVGAIVGAVAHEAVVHAKKWKKSIEEGSLTFRRMALLGGIGMFICGLVGIIAQTFNMSPTAAVIQVYITVFGLVVFMLESKQYLKTNKYELVVEKYCYFLALPKGRGVFYIFLGSLAMGQWDTINIVLGSYMILTGILCIGAAAHAAKKLNDCRKVLKDEESVRDAFQQFDSDHNQFMDMEELKLLAAYLGSEMTANEMEASMILMDSDCDGKLDIEEFLEWWRGEEVSSFLV